MLLEAVDIDAELLVLISELLIEVLLEVQVTLHIGDLAVPEVKLAPLLLVILLHQGDAMVHFSLLLIFFLDLGVKVIDTTLHGIFVSIKGCSELLSSLSLLISLDLLKLKLPQANVDLVLLGRLPLDSQSVLFFASKLYLLEVLQGCGKLAKIAAKLTVFV